MRRKGAKAGLPGDGQHQAHPRGEGRGCQPSLYSARVTQTQLSEIQALPLPIEGSPWKISKTGPPLVLGRVVFHKAKGRSHMGKVQAPEQECLLAFIWRTAQHIALTVWDPNKTPAALASPGHPSSFSLERAQSCRMQAPGLRIPSGCLDNDSSSSPSNGAALAAPLPATTTTLGSRALVHAWGAQICPQGAERE